MFNRNNFLIIDGKNNNVPNLESMQQSKTRRDRYSTLQKCNRGPRDRLTGGEKVETFEHLENLLSQRDKKAHEEARQWLLDHQSCIPDDH
jgi:hypothetical protein